MSEEKLRAWREFSKDIPTSGKAALAVVEKDGLLLAVTREHDRSDWTLPGGKLEPDEDWLIALVREVREETGVTVVSAELVHEGTSDDDHLVRTYRCRAETLDVELKNSWEGDVGWVKPEELVKGCFSKYNDAALRKAGVDPSGEPPCPHDEVEVKRTTVCLDCGDEVPYRRER